MVTIEFNPHDLLIGLLIIMGIALLVVLTIAAYNLVKTLKKAQTVLTDFEVVSRIASERSKQLDNVIEQASKKLKSGQGLINSIPVIFSAISKIAKAVGQHKNKDSEGEKRGLF